MTTEELLKQLHEALDAAANHLEYCGYGDAWEREVAGAAGLEDKISAALRAAEEPREEAVAFVIMGNDFPDAVFSTKADADAYVEKKKREDAAAHPMRRIRWRACEYVIDAKREG